MPLDEQGAKWACEPCIRGHRSSKCEHFDRLMVKVAKAGRPLMKCPHPDQTCDCQKKYALMVRIPKGPTCVCRPVYQVSADPSRGPPPLPNLISEDVTQTPPFAATNGSSQHERRPRKNSSSPFDTTLANATKHEPNSGTQSCCSSKRLRRSASPVNERKEDLKITKGSCCKEEPREIDIFPSARRASTQVSLQAPEYGNDQSRRPSIANYMQQMRYQYPHNSKRSIDSVHTSTPSPAQPWSMNQPISNNVSTPNPMSSYTQPPQARAGSFDFNGMAAASMQPHFAPQQNSQQHQLHSHSQLQAEHECFCGDNCQCLGCASHPFNQKTRQTVQEMGSLIMADHGYSYHAPDVTPAITPPANFPPLSNGEVNSSQPLPYHPLSSNGDLNNSFSIPSKMPGFAQDTSVNGTIDTSSTPPFFTEQTPASIPLQDDLIMAPTAYYEVEYPVQLPIFCTDVTGTCRCGENCCCNGCLTHAGHTGIYFPLGSPFSEQPQPHGQGQMPTQTQPPQAQANLHMPYGGVSSFIPEPGTGVNAYPFSSMSALSPSLATSR